MFVESRAVAPFFKNGFVLADPDTRHATLIDPGDEVDDLLDVIARERFSVEYILLTHAHVDHITGVGRAKAALGAKIALHRDDLFLYDNVVAIGRMFGMTVAAAPPVDIFYQRDSTFHVGSIAIRPYHTPGHCPGGVCLAAAGPADTVPTLFVGDTLFAGSIGRTDLPGGDHATLLDSIRRVLFAFGDEARVLPGHGPETTIGRERQTNPFLS